MSYFVILKIWKGGRVVEGARLEIVCTSRYRGFESLPFRQKLHVGTLHTQTLFRYTGDMQDSIFTKIIKGEIPSHKIYEDDKTYAFLDIHPASEGHTLVVAKKQVEFVWDLEDVDYAALMSTVKKVAYRLRAVYPTRVVGELVIGVDIPHAHVHLIPFRSASEIKNAIGAPMVEPDHEVLASVAQKLYFS